MTGASHGARVSNTAGRGSKRAQALPMVYTSNSKKIPDTVTETGLKIKI
jgi:hypothetical protein